MQTYDAIVIGSGIGGLAAASFLAQQKKYRVLVLEQHFKAGGFTHTFFRKGYEWDVGVHYVGRMAEGFPLRLACDFMTAGRVKWTKMRDPFEEFHYPGFKLEVPSDPDQYLAKLIALFPAERESLQNYFRDLRVLPKYLMVRHLPWWMRPFYRIKYRRAFTMAEWTTKRGLDFYFRDAKLKAVLASQWGDYGLPPSRSSFIYHMTIAEHYLRGGFYPEGGSGEICRAVKPLLEAHGGNLYASHRVEQILVESNRAVGVTASNGGKTKTFYAREIYSDAGAYNTFTKLLPENCHPELRAEVANGEPGESNVTLYLGLKESPASLGVHGQNLWIYSDWDHDRSHARSAELLHGKVSSCYVSFPSLKDTTKSRHTVEILAFVPFGAFEKWRNTGWQKRGEDYESTKQQISRALLDYVETYLPGLKALVEYQELSTPLTVRDFAGHREGEIYGFPATPARLKRRYLQPRTLVKNLFLVGTDASGFGIAGALIGGYLGVAAKHGFFSLRRVFKLRRPLIADRENHLLQ